MQSGDTVVVPKTPLKLVQHHALYLGHDDFGNHYMCENVIGNGVKLTRVQDFFHSVSEVTRIEKFHGNDFTRKLVVQKALLKLGQPYHLINYNCESFCNDIRYARPKSKQVEKAFVFTSFLGLILLITGIGSSK
ncbi:MAG: lecithin retinol acyltransferase family protein [Bacteroidetes bacterium]|nr:lecithin retinol acyltransferase family protein [Bacteroidota bacterium]